MSKTCSSCGATSLAEARFCRRCGAPLRTNVGDDNAEGVSPLAATAPLSDDGRATDGLSPEEPRRTGPETARVNRAELDSLLRAHARPTPAPDSNQQSFDPQATSAQLGQQTHTGEQFGQQTHADEQFGQQTIFDPSLQAMGEASQTFEHNTEGLPTSDLTQKFVQPNGDDALHANDVDDDEELTISVARPDGSNLFRGGATPVRVVPAGSDVPANVPPVMQQHAPPPTNAPPPAPRASHARQLWYVAAAASLLLLIVTGVAVWLGIGYFRKQSAADLTNVSPPPADNKQLFAEKLAEAESLLAKGDLDAAIAALRQATTLDPSNAAARRRLGDLLLDNGRRREAIEEFRAITRLDARDAEGWRSLARAQLDESLYDEAAQSYQRLIALSGESSLNDNELLSYAEALRLSGRTDEARPFYERLASSAFAEVSNAARQRLSELNPSATPQVSASPDLAHAQPDKNRQTQVVLSQPTPAPTPVSAQPTPAPTAQPTPPPAALSSGERFARGEQLWSSNRGAALNEFRAAAAQGNPDAFYYLGLSIMQGREPSALQRAELGAALQYFQNAQRGGKFRSQAQRYEEQLGKEFDKRRQK